MMYEISRASPRPLFFTFTYLYVLPIVIVMTQVVVGAPKFLSRKKLTRDVRMSSMTIYKHIKNT